MGFLTGTTIELTAKLTPSGRTKLITNNNTLITSFSLGDSDAYYPSSSGLTIGTVPAVSGNYDNITLNNGGINYTLRSTLFLDPSTDKKAVESVSNNIATTFIDLGYTNLSGNALTQNIVDLNDVDSDALTNLFYSFSLPLTTSDFTLYTATTYNVGGYSNTAFSGIAQTKILVIGINNNGYGELIDGKSIKLDLETSASTYSIYSTYQTTTTSKQLLDTDYVDTSSIINVLGPNRALLFSDSIQRPNSGATTSWATGYATNKPFSINGKESYNFTNNPNLNQITDVPVGIAYLDKGFMVITEPSIVDNFILNSVESSGTTIEFNHIKSSVSQQITCLANRGEFIATSNYTWVSTDIPRITEIGLFDNTNTLIAIAKLNETYLKPSNDMVGFNITLEY